MTLSPHLMSLYEQAMADAQRWYDPRVGLVASGSLGESGGQTFRPAASLPFAEALIRAGNSAGCQQAWKIIAAVLDSQQADPDLPHCGNFKWLSGDVDVADLNAVVFVLRGLLPILVLFEHSMPGALSIRCHAAVRLALTEVERLNVAPTYTNIHLMSLFGLLVGGEWLNDDHYSAIGRMRWNTFVSLMLASGAPHEYNSSNYLAVDLSVLAQIKRLLADPSIRCQAGLLYERFWLHLALHIHTPTGQLAGPHSRSYWSPMITGNSMVGDLLWRETGNSHFLGNLDQDRLPVEFWYALELVLTDHQMPGYLRSWLERGDGFTPYEVRETAERASGLDLTTYFTPAYALGTASSTYRIGTDCYYIEHQANNLILHYARPGLSPNWSLAYSRFVINDRHWGTLGAAPDRPKTANFYEQGSFAGVQMANKAIGLYALLPESEEVFSVKTLIAFQAGDRLERVWINQHAVDLSDLPRELALSDWLVVEDGTIYLGVHALAPSCMGPGAGVTLQRGPLGELWLCISNYQGRPKRFWEYASLGGAFWQGNIRAGYVLEIAQRGEYASAVDFYRHLQASVITDEVDDHQVRHVTFASGADQLALDFDLLHTCALDRRLNDADYRPPSLSSPLAVQSESGELRLGEALLRTPSGVPVWLICAEGEDGGAVIAAVNPQTEAIPMALDTPLGAISAEAWPMGRIECQSKADGSLVIWISGIERPAGLVVPENAQLEHNLAFSGEGEKAW